MLAIIRGMKYYIKGLLFLISHQKFHKYLWWSCAISAFIAFVTGNIAFFVFVKKFATLPLKKKIFIGAIIVIVAGTLYFIVNNICTEYAMRNLSEGVEKEKLGKLVLGDSKSFRDSLADVWYRVRSVPKTIILMFLNFIPVLGQLMTFYHNGVSSMGHAFDRRNHSKRDINKLLKKKKLTVFGFGMACAISFFIPPLTFLYRPISIAGGTIMAIEYVEDLST